MNKFAPLQQKQQKEGSGDDHSSASAAESNSDDTRSHYNDNDTSRSSAAYYVSSSYYDESSYFIPDVSSVCDDSEAFALALAEHNNNNNSNNNAVGSTSMTFQDFLLCFDERIHSGASAKALTKTTSTASSSASSNKYQQFRQLLPNNNNKQLQQQQRVLRVRSAESNNKLASLPHFLWQPDDGLCCHADNVHHMMQNEQNELNQQNNITMEGLVLFEEPSFGDDDDDDDADNHAIQTSAATDQEEREPTERPRSSSLGNHSFLVANGGTTEDPRYVPRPSSTTPGLREMSKLFHTSSLPEDKLAKTYHSWKAATKAAKAADDEEDDILPPTSASMAPPQAPVPRNALQASKLLLLTKSKSTPPIMFSKHRRTRSEDHQCHPVPQQQQEANNSRLGLPPRHDHQQQGENGDHAHGINGKKGQKRTTMKNLFRRSRLPSFRKPKFPSGGKQDNNNTKEVKMGSAVDVDVANILASLEETHLQQQQSSRSNKKVGKLQPQRKGDRSVSCSPTKSLMSAQSLTQGTGDTHSDTSSLEEIFGNVEEDDFDDCYSESSQESRDSDDLDMFATPYSSSDQDQFSGYYSKTGSKTSSWEQYTSRKADRNDMLSHKTELSRCGSIDTAKASNLTYDPAADQAKRLELQALLKQQQEEREKRLNAPPIEFDAPDGDNVIRVRDAVCEIEVLPKCDRGLGHSGLNPETTAEF